MSDFGFIFSIFSIMVLSVGVSIFYIKKETQKLIASQQQQEMPFSMIKQDIENLRKRVEDGYSKMAQELGMVKEIGRNIKEFQEFLRSPKLRGNIGEQVLKDLLSQVLPHQNFALQYRFQTGDIVDAVIKTNQGIIPIDSKFPMENFQRMNQETNETQKQSFEREFKRDVKKHIDAIAKKYILPNEGTVDFALMYIPSEPIYYEIAINQPDIVDYGYQKKIYLVSPNSFYYFLKIVLMGLQGAKIEEGAKKILEKMKSVQQEVLKFDSEFSTLLTHIDHTKSASERTRTRFEKLIGKIEKLGELEESEEGLEKLPPI